MDAQGPSIEIDELRRRLAAPQAPLVIDVRRAAAYDAADRIVVGALRGDPAALGTWAAALPAQGEVFVYCAHGHEVSRDTATALRRRGINAAIVSGGFEGWRNAGGPTRTKAAGVRAPLDPPTRWVTRERPKIDRVACPWLIRRFVDRDAEIAFVPAAEVGATARRTGAEPFDVPGVRFSHEGERCSFDAFLRIFGIEDPALDTLATIVRGADTARLDLAPQSAGLLAISLGLSHLLPDDDEMCARGFLVYDALYAWARGAMSETHGWPPRE